MDAMETRWRARQASTAARRSPEPPSNSATRSRFCAGSEGSELARVDLPAGLKLKMELQDGFDSATAAIGDAVRMRVVEDVRWSGKPVLPDRKSTRLNS